MSDKRLLLAYVGLYSAMGALIALRDLRGALLWAAAVIALHMFFAALLWLRWRGVRNERR